MSNPIIEATRLCKHYRKGDVEVVALDGVDCRVPAGDFLALMGPSGSGKSTLLHLLAGLDTPSSGSLKVAGTELAALSPADRNGWRARHVGFVFQTFNLIPVLTAVENVELPLSLRPMSGGERRQRARTALELVGLGDRLDHLPRQLSQGQEQRVALARALVADPPLLLADEPTGNLDARSTDEVMELLVTLNASFGKTIVMVTHDPRLTDRVKSVHHLDKGCLIRSENERMQPVQGG